jgi:hypothetical protein
MTKSSGILSGVTTGILYKNATPHLKSVHGYFPSVAALPSGELLATYALGEAFEATNLRTYVARSGDGGQNWRQEGPLAAAATEGIVSEFARVSVAPDGELVVVLVRCDRTDHAEEGLANPATMGFVPTEVLLVRSVDDGRTWSKPLPIEPPLTGPFELCTPLTFLRDGRWLWPTSIWQDWNGTRPSSGQMVAFASPDRGQSWPAYLDVMRCPDNNLTFWESKIVELSDGRLLAVAWCYDRAANADRPNQYAISCDGGSTWSSPESTGLQGQTLTPCLLANDRVLCVYRRIDQPGLWANLSHFEGNRWHNDGCQPLWGYDSAAGLTAREANMTHTFNKLKFGAPALTRLADDAAYLAFWCYEDNVGIIRWSRFTVD